jgi:hypothetical protein
MFDFQSLGKLFLVLGGIIFVLGLLFMVGGRVFPWLGNLPGDIRIERGNVSCFFPLVTSIILSIVLTIVVNLVIRLLNR